MGRLIAGSEYSFTLQELIDGDTWFIDNSWNADVGTSKAMWIQTGAQGILFRAFVSSTAAPLRVRFYEDGSVTGGVPIDEHNFNRRSSNTTEVTCQRDGTADPWGDLILTMAQTLGESPDPVVELWLKPNTLYGIDVKNEGAVATTIYTRFCWCE